MAESTALEALTAELLGDVGLLHDQIKELRETIPSITDDLAKKIELQTGYLIEAGNNLNKVMVSMSQKVDEYASASVNSAVEAGKLEINKAAITAAKDALKSQIGREVNEVVGFINEAAKELVKETQRTQETIREAAQEARWGWFKGLTICMAGGVLSASVLTIFLYYSGIAPRISDDDKRSIERDHRMSIVWKNLSKQERDHITDVMQKTLNN
jgi:hypothetical protein